MYTHFNNLYINKKVDNALLNISYVQNDHHQHPCIVDNNLQHSGILLVLLAVEGRQYFFSCMLHVAVFLVFCAHSALQRTPTAESNMQL